MGGRRECFMLVPWMTKIASCTFFFASNHWLSVIKVTATYAHYQMTCSCMSSDSQNVGSDSSWWNANSESSPLLKIPKMRNMPHTSSLGFSSCKKKRPNSLKMYERSKKAACLLVQIWSILQGRERCQQIFADLGFRSFGSWNIVPKAVLVKHLDCFFLKQDRSMQGTKDGGTIVTLPLLTTNGRETALVSPEPCASGN